MTHAQSATEPIIATERLTTALEATAAALAVPTLDALLASEAALQHAVAALPRPGLLAPAERVLLRQQLEAARSALARCRRLGDSFNDFIRISLDAQGGAIGYDRSRLAPASHALNTRA